MLVVSYKACDNVSCYFDEMSMLQRCGVNTATDPPADDDDLLAVPTRLQSEHSIATSSAQEVEDCEDLEVVGIQPDESKTDLVGVTWISKAGRDDRVLGDESFTRVEGLKKVPGQYVKDGSVVDNESDSDDTDRRNAGCDGEPHNNAIKPAAGAFHQSYSQIGGFKSNSDRSASPGSSNDNIDDDGGDDKNNAKDTANQPNVAISNQSSSRTGESRETGRSETGTNAAADDADDFDDFDDDDDDESTGVALKPTLSPFSLLAAAAGGDHLSLIHI